MRYVFGDYVLDARRYELRRGGTPIKVRPKVFDVLAYLIVHRERVVTKQELLDQLWPDQFIGDATLNSCIMEARQAVGDTGQTQRIIHTVYGRGYRFVAPVESASQEPPVEEPSVTSTGPRDLEMPPKGSLDTATGTVSLQEVQGNVATSLTAITAHAPAKLDGAPRPSLEGERKQITILCCTLANATSLAETLGLDGMHGLMHGFFELAQREILRYEGTITQYLGDGFVALFGAPMAHEDHAQRGLLAAVGLQRSLGEHRTGLGHTSGQELAVRIGLHTGSVVVGSVGDDGGRLFTAVGPTTHVATHLQQLAEPGTILLSGAMSQLLEGYVSVELFGQTDATDKATSPPAYKFIGLARWCSPVARRKKRALSQFVGRQQELATLHALLARAESGQGQVVGIVGEAGLGKSRLLYEFRQSLQGKHVTYQEGRCLSYGQNTPYLPVLDLLRHTCGITDAESPALITTKIRLTLQEVGMDPEVGAPLLLHLLGVQAGPERLALYSPEALKTRTVATLQQLSLNRSRQRPLILEVEDLHWIDPTSEEFLVSLVDRLANAPIILLASYRPGYRPPWVDKSYATQLALPQLTRQESQSVVQSTLHTAPIAETLFQAVLEKGQGNPFFLEELARTLLERGDDGPMPAVPDTVQAVLAARIDRLMPEERHLLQTAAVIGMDVPGSLLQAIAEWPDEPLRHGLSQLQSAEFLYETHRFPEVDYRFKHALTQQVAYETLLQERRRVLHARLVEALEALPPERAAEQVERLAHHAVRGEVWDKAVPYCRQAGTKAFARAAFREAAAAFEQALVALGHLPESRDTREQAIDLRLDLRSVLGPLGERIFAHLREAEILAEALEDQRRLAQVSAYMGHYFWVRGDYDRTVASGQRALAIAEALGDSPLQLMPTYFLGQTYHALGDYRRAIDLLRRNLAFLEGDLLQVYLGAAAPPSVISHTSIVSCLAELGEFAEGIARGDEGVRIAEASAHPTSFIFAYRGVGLLYLRKGDVHKAIPALERCLALCQGASLLYHFPPIASALGAAYTLSGRVSEALPLLEQAVQQATSIRRQGGQSLRVASLSEATLQAGRLEEALSLAQKALELAQAHKERGNEAWILRLLGEIAAQSDPLAIKPAEHHYRQALALAEALGMRPLQAHCHFGLGTLYAKIGRPEQARADLSSAVELYRAMDMTFWLTQAEAMLAQVEGR